MKRSTVITFGILFIIVVVMMIVTVLILRNDARVGLEQSAAGVALQASSTAAYTDLSGAPLSLATYIGSPLVVLSFASWCPTCADQIRALNAVAAERPDVTFMAINRAEPATTVERFLSYHQIEATDKVLIVLDARDHFYQSVKGYAAPETVFFNEKGEIVAHLRGDISADTLRTTLP